MSFLASLRRATVFGDGSFNESQTIWSRKTVAMANVYVPPTIPPTSVSILVVDDFEPWLRQVCSMLQTRPYLRVVAEAGDGLEAVQKAKELQPDLIVLDFGLSTLNGLEAATRIRQLAPDSKIIFLTSIQRQRPSTGSFERWSARLRLKVDAGRDLFTAVEGVPWR